MCILGVNCSDLLSCRPLAFFTFRIGFAQYNPFPQTSSARCATRPSVCYAPSTGICSLGGAATIFKVRILHFPTLPAEPRQAPTAKRSAPAGISPNWRLLEHSRFTPVAFCRFPECTPLRLVSLQPSAERSFFTFPSPNWLRRHATRPPPAFAVWAVLLSISRQKFFASPGLLGINQ